MMNKLVKQQVLSCKWFCTFQRTIVPTNFRQPVRTQHYHTNYATRTNESCTFYEEHKLRLTLIDLGMKLVCVPRNIYEQFEDRKNGEESCQRIQFKVTIIQFIHAILNTAGI
jgi:hypothetical protein